MKKYFLRKNRLGILPSLFVYNAVDTFLIYWKQVPANSWSCKEFLKMEEVMIDFKSKLGRKALRHIKQEYFIWLTTIDSKGTPQPRPVWFVLEGDSLVIYSQPGAFKLKHIVNNPNVSLHFNTPDPKGEEDVIVFSGVAKIDPKSEPVNKNNIYMRKYRNGIKGLNSTPQQFTHEYSTMIRIKLTSLRGW